MKVGVSEAQFSVRLHEGEIPTLSQGDMKGKYTFNSD